MIVLPKIVTLKLNSDFRRVYARGRSYADPALVTYVFKNRAGICRIGITTSKKLGNAVERNRCRRIIKEAFRQNSPLCVGGFDLVFVARQTTKFKKSTQIQSVMQNHLNKAGVIRNSSDFKSGDRK